MRRPCLALRPACEEGDSQASSPYSPSLTPTPLPAVITVDRLITIKFPFDVLEPSVVRGVMAGVWVCVGALAALPLSRLDYFGNFYGRSGVCLALHITNEKPDGWEYAVFIFLGEGGRGRQGAAARPAARLEMRGLE